jgi:hypothetical protein
VILSSDEGLEVVVNDGFGDPGQALETSPLKEDGVPAEPLGHPGDRRLRAKSGP